MDKLYALEAFIKIVDAGSLTAAAEALDVSQPSMVRTLAALERDLGVRHRSSPAAEQLQHVQHAVRGFHRNRS